LAAAIDTALEAGNDPAHPANSYTVAYSPATRTFTITNNSGVAVDFLWENAATTAEQILGFTATNHAAVANAASTTSDNVSGGEGNRWHWYAVAPGADSTSGQIQVGAVGTIEFDTGGKLVQYTQGFNSFNFEGGVTQLQQISFDFANGAQGTLGGGSGLTGTTQFGTSSSVLFQSQDGYTAGSLQSLIVNQNGSMTGVFTNGQTLKVADVALARFIAPTELTKAGRNLYTESNGSGVAIIGTAATSGRGRIFANSLEASNVDLAEEFVKMIAMQRGFQGNTKVISAADELLTELGNIKR
jgi:flagellar hook protein FlgE